VPVPDCPTYVGLCATQARGPRNTVPDCPTYVGLCATQARTGRHVSGTQTNVVTVCCTNYPRSAAIVANYHCVDSLSLHSTTGRYSSHENYAKEWRLGAGWGGRGGMFYAQSTIAVISGRNIFCFHIVIVKKSEHAKTSIWDLTMSKTGWTTNIQCLLNIRDVLQRPVPSLLSVVIMTGVGQNIAMHASLG